MSRKKEKTSKDCPDTYVTRSECSEMMRHGESQFKEIKRALVGDEFGKIGGMVQDIAEIKIQLQTLKKNKWTPRDKALVLAAALAMFGCIMSAIIAAVWH
jgi:hypothetical protein